MDAPGASGPEKEKVNEPEKEKVRRKVGKREEGVKGSSMISPEVGREGRTQEPYTPGEF